MLPDRTTGCHRTGFAKTCFACVTEHSCQLWVNIQGIHPQTGETVNNFGCSDRFLPLLMVENSRKQGETGAAVESFRNEVVKMNTLPLTLGDVRALDHHS